MVRRPKVIFINYNNEHVWEKTFISLVQGRHGSNVRNKTNQNNFSYRLSRSNIENKNKINEQNVINN